jgi:hypothetical protein
MRCLRTMAACVGLATSGMAAMAQDKCPKGDAPIFEEDLQAVASCAAAHELHDACAWASSGDAGLSGVVISKCESGFLSKLSKPQKAIYDRRGDRCDAAYPNDTNSMQVFQMSMCREQLSVLYDKAAGAGPIKKAPRWKGPDPAE